MNRKMYWGITALIVILIAAGGFIYWQWSQVQQLKEEVAQDNKLLEEHNQQKQPPIDYTKPPPGKTFANGGHWHNGEWHDAAHEPIAQPSQTEQVVYNDVPSAPPKKVLSDEEMREFRRKNFSPEELARLREIETTFYPKDIEKLKKRIVQAEKTYNEMLARIRKYGPYTDPLGQHLFEQTKRDLDQMKLELASKQRILEVHYGYKYE